MTQPINISTRGLYFLAIGSFAALAHISLVYGFVTLLNTHPLLANVLGFLMAFNISYFGHKHFTFSKLKNKKSLSLPHFFIVATSAGFINEGLYYLLLKYTTINYLLALILVLVLVSGYSFIVSKIWACR
ncbi:MAG: GtrA family protein [Legionella sp.]|nr:GtrA family protein [Legionella sp.]